VVRDPGLVVISYAEGSSHLPIVGALLHPVRTKITFERPALL
jgi:hypothetical protein